MQTLLSVSSGDLQFPDTISFLMLIRYSVALPRSRDHQFSDFDMALPCLAAFHEVFICFISSCGSPRRPQFPVTISFLMLIPYCFAALPCLAAGGGAAQNVPPQVSRK